jgi:large subunit ribosomal protein L19
MFSLARRSLATSARRAFATQAAATPSSSTVAAAAATSATAAYRFSAKAKVDASTRTLEPGLKLGKGLMQHLHQTLPNPEKQIMLARFLARQGPDRILPGSILTVHSSESPTVFSGVVISIRRRGPDTSFVLRNIVQRTGVEVQYFVNSPHVQKIDVVRRGPPAKRGRQRTRRAKMFYIRHSAEKMSTMASH